MHFKVLIVLTVCVCIGYSKRLLLPSYIKACKGRENNPNLDKCMLEHGREAIPGFLKGDRKYNIPNLTPLVVSSVTLGSGADFKLVATDLHFYGLDGINLKQIHADLRKRKISLNCLFDKVNIIGKYEVNGKLLVIPIQGNGDINITIAGLDLTYNLNYDLQHKEGEEYILVSDGKTDFTITRAYFHLDNLFNGNKELGDSTNQILNEQWDKFIDTLKPVITETIISVVTNILNGIVTKVPYKEIFPE